MSLRATYNVIDRANDDNPCRYCTEEDGRREGCHAECMDYFFWEIVQEHRREESHKEGEAVGDYIGYKRDILQGYGQRYRRK